MIMPTSPAAKVGTATAAVPKCHADTPFAPALAPRASEQLHRLRGDLKVGLPVLVRHDGDTVLLALIETLTDARYNAMTALGQPELVITRRRAEALGIHPPIQGDTLRFRLPAGADRGWLASVAGQGGVNGGDIGAGLPILQAATALHRATIELARTMEVLPAILTIPLAGRDETEIAALGLSSMTLAAVTEALDEVRSQTRVSSARLPMDVSASGRVHVFRPDDGGTEHYAIEVGTPDFSAPVLVRLHSACFTGDVLGSLKCDCGPQLRAAMAAMAEAGGGVLIYLNQEGRGIGLANKMRAYALQDAGLDTVEANHWLGFEDDQRDFRIGAQMLGRLGIGKVRLMTNNPAKMASLSALGVEVVERVPLRVGRTAQNADYLATKAAKSGHLL